MDKVVIRATSQLPSGLPERRINADDPFTRFIRTAALPLGGARARRRHPR